MQPSFGMRDASAALLQRAREFVDDALLYRNTPPEEAARIAEHGRVQTVLVTRPLMLVACFVGLLWWPFDYLLYGCLLYTSPSPRD